ncbi:hypothetical protein PIB30_084952, partial [Stylosanthes scabra]|nr:hypothetical protein [Stylosanthes scabra]
MKHINALKNKKGYARCTSKSAAKSATSVYAYYTLVVDYVADFGVQIEFVSDIGPGRPKSSKIHISSPSFDNPAQILCGPTSCSINPQRIERGSTPLSGTSSKPYHIACVRRAPKSLFGEALLAHTYLSHKPSTFRLGTSGYAGSPKPLE